MRVTTTILLAAVLAGSANAEQSASVPAMPSWLAGGWVMGEPDGKWFEEWWTPARAGVMLGAGRSGAGSSLEWWEQTRIEIADGKLRFCALPKGQAGACFAAVKSSATEIVFENAAHDYPQRVRYSLDGGELHAEIALKDGSKPNRWRFKRIN